MSETNPFEAFTAHERELLWDALAEHVNNVTDVDSVDIINNLVATVSSTFSWMNE